MYALSWCLGNLLPENMKCTTLILLYVKPPLPVYSSLDATEYLFGGDDIASMEKYGRDLASSVMRRAEAVYRDVNTNVCVCVCVYSRTVTHTLAVIFLHTLLIG
ncbi:GTPase [Actinidia chinensis var. chinensis]|uniref:GTPase n=1 Tax=Actinidia chinensis var. chinensis TaxID=1590841 RepID=A0A2R6P5N2_ACTCC|nr:GTPase [Actinidia chinensis var. chinensis]